MAAVIETCKPTNTSIALKDRRPKRDFLREHREYLRNIQSQKTAKTKSAISSGIQRKELSGNMVPAKMRTERSLNVTSKSKDFIRLAGTADATITRQPIEKRLGTFISKNVEARKRAGAAYSTPLTSDQFVQTCDIEEESFLEGAKLLSPSEFVLEAIRTKSQPPAEPKPKPVRRKVDRHTCVLNAHLSDLKEFLEKGSVSRRKKSEAQKNPHIQKFLMRGRMNVRGGTSRPNFELESKKNATEKRIMDNIKSSILFGCHGKGRVPPDRARLTTISKKEAIGDGPKRSGDHKLIVVYQKE